MYPCLIAGPVHNPARTKDFGKEAESDGKEDEGIAKSFNLVK